MNFTQIGHFTKVTISSPVINIYPFPYFRRVTVHEIYMQRCLELAKLGQGRVAPNPMVGAVVVYQDKIVGEGFHQAYGSAHAEINAIHATLAHHPDFDFSCASIYVNLEPCSHHGKTPPCADLLIQKKFREVFIGIQDPFTKVNGSGIQKLRSAGIHVECGILDKECKWLNRRFLCYHQQQRPYILLKYAQSKDGFIASEHPNPENRWITGVSAQRLVHKWRSENDAILIGRKTAQTDNPHLNVRLWEGKNPLRIVLDPRLELPEDLNVFKPDQKTIVFNSLKDESREFIHFIRLNFKENPVQELLNILYRMNIQSLIVEGGAQTLNEFIRSDSWDEARIFTGLKEYGNGIAAPEIQGRMISSIKIGDDQLKVLIPNNN